MIDPIQSDSLRKLYIRQTKNDSIDFFSDCKSDTVRSVYHHFYGRRKHYCYAYYKKKLDQGKHHLTATGAVARKLTTVIYAVLRDDKPYEPKKFC